MANINTITPIFYYGFDSGINSNNTVLVNGAYSSNVSNTIINGNIVINSQNSIQNSLISTSSSSSIPITTNLYARYEAKNYRTSTNIWTDSGPNGYNIPSTSITGNVRLVKNELNSNGTSNVDFFVLHGDSGSIVNIGNSILSSWTIFSIARYAGERKGRIITNLLPGNNFLSGHWNGNSGIAHHEGWVTQTGDLFGTDFFINTATASNMRVNGKSQGIGGNGRSTLPNLYINGESEPSDWQVVELIIYNTELTIAQRVQMENYLSSYYGITSSNSNLTACSAIMVNGPTLVTSDFKYGNSSVSFAGGSFGTNSQFVSLPQFNLIASTGLTFVLWFKSNCSTLPATLFEFGNGASSDNIIAQITSSGNLGIVVYTGANYCSLGNVYGGCNNNTWTHFAWTISADGLTWIIYINGNSVATITNSNKGSYSYTTSATAVTINHPASLVRSTNNLAKSSFSTNGFFKGSIDEFYMYNSTLSNSNIISLFNNSNPVSYYATGNFLYKGNYIVYPSSTITAYVGTTDPDGWVMCDGVQRTNGTDGRYNTLITMGVGSGTANVNYTPPNLKGSFLRATGTDPTGKYMGPNLNTTQTHTTQTHTHSASITKTDPGHTHNFKTYNDDYNQSNNAGQQNPAFYYNFDSIQIASHNYSQATSGVSASLSINNSTTNNNNDETRPYNYSINWIIKY
jgi:hypothetical protein